MRALLLLLICLTASALPAQERAISSDLIETLDSGVVCAPPTTGEKLAPDTIAGVTHLIDTDPPFVSTKNRVPAVLGIGFGVKSSVRLPDGLAGVTMTITHPPIGPEGITQQSFQTSISGGGQSLTFYQFDYDYEMQTGDWLMEASLDGIPLYAVAFEVVLPQQIPELAQVCGFENLLS